MFLTEVLEHDVCWCPTYFPSILGWKCYIYHPVWHTGIFLLKSAYFLLYSIYLFQYFPVTQTNNGCTGITAQAPWKTHYVKISLLYLLYSLKYSTKSVEKLPITGQVKVASAWVLMHAGNGTLLEKNLIWYHFNTLGSIKCKNWQ